MSGLAAVLAGGTLLAASVGARAASRAELDPASAWAGYVLSGQTADPAGAPVAFNTVSASWTQPAVICTPGDAGAATDIWIGLGGYANRAQELEQIGSAVGCDKHGKPLSSAWFALLPYPMHTIVKRVRPGDRLHADVTVLPLAVRIELDNRTRAWAYVRTIAAAPNDTTSAEWIVEAPMGCLHGHCARMALASFDSVRFSALAVTADGQAITPLTPGFGLTALALVPPAAMALARRATARPGPLEPTGNAFTVSWLAPPPR
jgi:hypothetical protein